MKRPRFPSYKGLSQGQYFETIEIRGSGNTFAYLNANFIVSAKAVILTGIINPSDISGVPNGAPKNAAGLLLPGAVVITTTSGNMSAAVAWDTAGCKYDPALKSPQSFTVYGKVTLPDGVQNDDGIQLVSAVRVTVTGRSPVIPDPSGNQITGIYNGQVFTTDYKITFCASGAGYENTAPVEGDIRYVPWIWNVVEDRTWECEPFSGQFRIGRAGNYILTVTFLQQCFDGSTWANTGGQDVKTVSFSVQGGKPATMTPVPGVRNTPRTGDDNNYIVLIIALAAAAAAIAAVAVILVKRRKK